MSKNRRPNLVVGIVASFMSLAGVIIFLLAKKIVSVEVGILMLVMSAGMHLGFGILIAVHRLIDKLE
jgi:Na+-translocating ferredoxin:NAD+ oxidoreductase RnfE subunit